MKKLLILMAVAILAIGSTGCGHLRNGGGLFRSAACNPCETPSVIGGPIMEGPPTYVPGPIVQ